MVYLPTFGLLFWIVWDMNVFISDPFWWRLIQPWLTVWCGLVIEVTQIPPGFTSIAYTSNTEFAAVEDQVGGKDEIRWGEQKW